MRTVQTIIAGLAVAVFSPLLWAQPAPDVLTIDIENAVRYFADVVDPSKLATVPGPVPAATTRAYTDTIFIGDIVAVNGQPARGLWTSRQYSMNFRPNPQPGMSISDATQGTIAECKYEIQNEEGAFIGRLADTGLFPHAITGGTGAFMGARGEQASATPPVAVPIRAASMQEDPANRRVNGGGTSRIVIRLYPAFRPEVEKTDLGHTVLHGNDFSPVSPQNPANRGEVLILRARNLGPTTPAVTLGAAFPTTSNTLVNAPVEILVNGKATSSINKLGWPGEVNLYRVDFRVPDDVTPGTAELQIRAAWLTSEPVKLPVR